MADDIGRVAAARDERNARGDERQSAAAGGYLYGVSGAHRRGTIRALLAIVALLVLVDTVNVFTALNDAANRGAQLDAWEPITWEFTSGLSTLVSCGIAYAALLTAPPSSTRWPAFFGIHLAASVLFSALHILLMNVMRVAIYATYGYHYRFGASGYLYEYRKDLIAYIVIAGIFWLFSKPDPRSTAIEQSSSAPQMFDIHEGSRLVRVRIDEIAALRAAGNYVEFVLTDGRRPLMRGSLGEIHKEVNQSAFVRTHRSWAVNMVHVRGLRPAGSGDFLVELDGGENVPVSRRFPDALLRLRAGASVSRP